MKSITTVISISGFYIFALIRTKIAFQWFEFFFKYLKIIYFDIWRRLILFNITYKIFNRMYRTRNTMFYMILWFCQVENICFLRYINTSVYSIANKTQIKKFTEKKTFPLSKINILKTHFLTTNRQKKNQIKINFSINMNKIKTF